MIGTVAGGLQPVDLVAGDVVVRLAGEMVVADGRPQRRRRPVPGQRPHAGGRHGLFSNRIGWLLSFVGGRDP